MKRTLIRFVGAIFVFIALPFYRLAMELAPLGTSVAALAVALLISLPGLYLIIKPGALQLKRRSNGSHSGPSKTSSV